MRLACATLAALLAAVTPSPAAAVTPSPAAGVTPSPAAGIPPLGDNTAPAAAAAQALLDEREAAVREGDRGRFLATVDPEADDEFVARQARLFDGLASLPIARYELRLRTDEIPDLSAGLEARYDGADVYLPPVELRYRIEGADRTDAVDDFFYTFVRRGGRWRIAADTDVRDVGLSSARNLWDYGPVEGITSEHFSVFFDPSDRARADAVAGFAEEGYERLALGGLGEMAPDQVVLVVPHTTVQLQEMLQANFDLSNFVAFAATTIDRSNGWATTSPRVFLNEATLSRSEREFQLQTLHHELIHVATFPLVGPFVPNWVQEGLASSMAGHDTPPGPVGDGALPEDYEFLAGGQESILTAYDESASAVSFLTETKGPNAPLDLLRAAGKPRTAPGTADHHVSAAIEAVYGAGLDEFQDDWSR